jgi:hypothetical protein
MTKRGKYFWITAGLAAALVLFFLAKGDSGPYYEGKPLRSYWFRQLILTMPPPSSGVGFYMQRIEMLTQKGHQYGHYRESPIVITNAIVAMGTNCIPFLMEKLGGHDSSLRLHIEKWMNAVRISRTPWRDADLERSQAMTALIILGEKGLLPEDAVKRIRTLSQDKDPGVAASAKWVLQTRGMN